MKEKLGRIAFRVITKNGAPFLSDGLTRSQLDRALLEAMEKGYGGWKFIPKREEAFKSFENNSDLPERDNQNYWGNVEFETGDDEVYGDYWAYATIEREIKKDKLSVTVSISGIRTQFRGNTHEFLGVKKITSRL